MGRSHSGKSATIQESNHGSGVCKEHYTQHYVPKSSILLAATGVRENSFVACGFNSFKAAYSVTFDLLILEQMFLFFKNTVK